MANDYKKLLDAWIIQQVYGFLPDDDCKFDSYQIDPEKPDWVNKFVHLKDHSTIYIKYDPDQFDYTP